MKNLRFHLFIFLIAMTACNAKSNQKQQTHKTTVFTDSTDQAIFSSIKKLSGDLHLADRKNADRIIEVAKMFLQIPYVGGTLETGGQEKLVVNLRGMDCTTYLENVLVFASLTQKRDFSEKDFCSSLEYLRYKNGKMTDYASRLHYFSDWIYENEKKGIVKNITAEMGGILYKKKINFMSTHTSAYPAFQSDSSLIAQIKIREDSINQRKLFFIPKDKIVDIEQKIEDGDLIAITTKIKGLDISHVGIAIHMNNRLHLLHASSLAKKVVISDIPLADMLKKSKLQSGIMIVRMQ